MQKENRTFDTEGRLLDFAVDVINVTGVLPETKVGNHISEKLIHGVTSFAPVYGEAQGAGSRADFINKMKVCLQALRQTKIWLLMIERADLVRVPSKLEPVIDENEALIAIFAKSINTAQQKREKG